MGPLNEVQVGSCTRLSGVPLLEGLSSRGPSRVCLSCLSRRCGSVTISLPVVLTISRKLTLSASLCFLLFCWQDKHLNPLDLPVTVSSTAVEEGLALPGGEVKAGQEAYGLDWLLREPRPWKGGICLFTGMLERHCR